MPLNQQLLHVTMRQREAEVLVHPPAEMTAGEKRKPAKAELGTGADERWRRLGITGVSPVMGCSRQCNSARPSYTRRAPTLGQGCSSSVPSATFTPLTLWATSALRARTSLRTVPADWYVDALPEA